MAEGGRELMEALFRATPRAGRGAPGWVTGAAQHAPSGSALRWHWQVEQGVIRAARYEVRGCPELMAGAALAAEALEGQPAGAPVLAPRELVRRLGAPADKLGHFLLIEDAALAAALQFRGRQP